MTPINEVDAKSIALSFVRELGINLPKEAEAELASSVHQALRYDANSLSAVVVDSHGNPMVTVGSDGAVSDLSVKDFIAQAAIRLGGKSASPPFNPPVAASKSVRDYLESRKAELRKQALEAASGPNPWDSGSRNFTKQGLISNHAPELAAQLKQQAGLNR